MDGFLVLGIDENQFKIGRFIIGHYQEPVIFFAYKEKVSLYWFIDKGDYSRTCFQIFIRGVSGALGCVIR